MLIITDPRVLRCVDHSSDELRCSNGETIYIMRATYVALHKLNCPWRGEKCRCKHKMDCKVDIPTTHTLYKGLRDTCDGKQMCSNLDTLSDYTMEKCQQKHSDYINITYVCTNGKLYQVSSCGAISYHIRQVSL